MILEEKHGLTHRRLNDFLSIFIVLFALYIILLPIVPIITLWIAKNNDETNGYVYQTNLQTDPIVTKKAKKIPTDNRLVLPTIQLDEAILEGNSFHTLERGLWRKPYTSTPDMGGNTVIAGHRFTYKNVAGFYHLDKIKLGDEFPLYWSGKEYDYKVVEIKVTSPMAVEVEHNTKEPTLTLYTCTPIWSPTQRLVVVSHLITEINE